MNFGLIPEFIGRLPVVSAVHQLRRDDLVRILTEPKNALVRQYQRFFGYDTIELVFTDDALWEIADKALARETGARGLRSIIEGALLDVMFELPSRRDVSKCVITRETIAKGLNPTLVTHGCRDELDAVADGTALAGLVAGARSRTTTWHDPLEACGGASGRLDGLDVLRRMVVGEPRTRRSPTRSGCGSSRSEARPRRVGGRAGRVSLQPDRHRPRGLRDDAARLGDGHRVRLDRGGGTASVTTLELKANFTRAITADTGVVRCTGTIVHRGRTVVTTEAGGEDAEERLLAHATSTILVLGQRPERAP